MIVKTYYQNCAGRPTFVTMANTLDIVPRKGLYSKYERPADAHARRKRTERRRRRQQQQQASSGAPMGAQQNSGSPDATALIGGMVLPSLGAHRQGSASMLQSVSLNALQPLGPVGVRPDATDSRVETAAVPSAHSAASLDTFVAQVETLGAASTSNPDTATATADRVADQLLAQFSLERAGLVPSAASSSSSRCTGAKDDGGSGAGLDQGDLGGASAISVLPLLSARSVADSVNSNAAEAIADADRQIELLLQRQRLAAAGAGAEATASGGPSLQLLKPLGLTPRLQQQRGSLGGALPSQRSSVSTGAPDKAGRKLAAARVKQHLRRSMKQHRPAKVTLQPSPWVTTCGGKGMRSAGEEAAEAAAAAATEEAAVATLLHKQGAKRLVADALPSDTSNMVGATPVLGSAAALEHFAASLSQQATSQAAITREKRRAAKAEEERQKAEETQQQQQEEAEAKAKEMARAKAEASAQRRVLLRQEFEKAAERRRQQEAQAAAGGPPLSKAAKEVAKSVARRQVLLDMEAAMDCPEAEGAKNVAEARKQQVRMQQKAAVAAGAAAKMEAVTTVKRHEDQKHAAELRRAKAEATRRRKLRENEESAQFLRKMEVEVRALGDLHIDADAEQPKQPVSAKMRGLRHTSCKPPVPLADDDDARTLREIDAKLTQLEEFAVSTLRLGSPVEKKQRAVAREEAAAVAAEVNASEWEKRVLADLQALGRSS